MYIKHPCYVHSRTRLCPIYTIMQLSLVLKLKPNPFKTNKDNKFGKSYSIKDIIRNQRITSPHLQMICYNSSYFLFYYYFLDNPLLSYEIRQYSIAWFLSSTISQVNPLAFLSGSTVIYCIGSLTTRRGKENVQLELIQRPKGRITQRIFRQLQDKMKDYSKQKHRNGKLQQEKVTT